MRNQQAVKVRSFVDDGRTSLHRMFAGVLAFLLAMGMLVSVSPSAFAEEAVQSEAQAAEAAPEPTAEPAVEQPGPDPVGDSADTETPVAPEESTPQPETPPAGEEGVSAPVAAEEHEDNTGGEGEDEPIVTATSLQASSTKIEAGDELVLTATVRPAAKGVVVFARGSTQLGEPVELDGEGEDSVAELKTKTLPIGDHSVTASFVPDDENAFAASKSTSLKIGVIGEVKVAGATLHWGVKTSFRKYITGPIAHGSITPLGTLVGQKSTGFDDSPFAWKWTKGAGKAKTDGSRADASFGSANGLYFQGHKLNVSGKTAYALDMRFTNPRVVVESPSQGKLYLDVKGRKFAGMTSVGDEINLKNVHVADLALPSPTADGKTLTWTGAEAILTAKGAEDAFGGFYKAGDELDPVTFSLPLDVDGDISGSNKTPTKTTLNASSSKIVKGQSVTITATVDPAINGKMTFSIPSAGISKTVNASGGKASLKLSGLKAVIHTARATFVPTDSEVFAHSSSNAVEITVTEKGKKVSGTTSGTGGESSRAAGSLRWSVSNYFTAYTTEKSKTAACPTPSKHCAGGSVVTSGVGAGWLWPQAAGTKWNEASQTGTVQFSGSVSFRGYGMTMFQVTNPSITVNSATSATLHTGYSGSHGPSSVPLNLGAATKSVGAGGEVTWSNVPVQGGLSGISAGQQSNFDSLTFTVGSVGKVSYGSTAQGAGAKKKAERTAADAPPARSGITILTDAKKITEGGRLQLESAGFEPGDEGILVVLYKDGGSGPIVLDEEAKADEGGRVEWSGTLPKQGTGDHVITLQGSIDTGAPIDILEKGAKKSAKSADAKRGSQASAARIAEEQAAAAGLIPGTGMALWEWWLAAGGLVAIAACTTLLAVRQRQS